VRPRKTLPSASRLADITNRSLASSVGLLKALAAGARHPALPVAGPLIEPLGAIWNEVCVRFETLVTATIRALRGDARQWPPPHRVPLRRGHDRLDQVPILADIHRAQNAARFAFALPVWPDRVFPISIVVSEKCGVG